MAPLFPRFRSAFYGFTLPLDAARLILRERSLLIWAVIPIVITLVLYIVLLGALENWAQDLLSAYFVEWGWDAGGWLAWTVSVIAKLLLILVGALTFAFSSSIVASPFNDHLAEKTERFAVPPLPPVTDHSLGRQARLILIDLAKTVGATVAGILALLFSLIPGVNVVAFVIAFLLVCFQYTSYPQTRRGVGFREGVRFLWRHFWACGGFGAAITILFAIPFLASLVLPVAVVSGTLLVARAPGSATLPPLR